MTKNNAVRHVLVAVLAAGVTVTGATLATPAPAWAAVSSWAQDGYGPGNTGYNPNESQLNASTVNDLSYRWSRLLEPQDPECDEPQFTPVVAGGRAFTSDGLGMTMPMRRPTGSPESG